MLIEVIILAVITILIYHHQKLKYWTKRNVPFIEGEFLFGSIKEIILGKKGLPDFLHEIYREKKNEGLVGFYSFYSPMALVTKPEVIQELLVKKFNSFADNGYRIYKDVDPMFGINPFCTTGIQNWKRVRGLHAPFHTPGKMKDMFPIIKTVAGNMINYLKTSGKRQVELYSTMGSYTMDNVVSCYYGLEPSGFTEKENPFKNYATSALFTRSSLANLSALFFPGLAKILKVRIISGEAEKFFISMIKSTVEYRKENEGVRNDFINHLIKQSEKSEGNFDYSDLAGHCVTVYLDGYETTGSALSFCLLELANHQSEQDELRKEITSIGSSLEDFDHDKIQSLSRLTMVVNEVLRLHPLLPILSRECTQSVELNGFQIDKGTKMFIPVESLHFDEELFPQPNVFNPERFAEEGNIQKYSFLPFGEGPRICLGQKFGLLQIKVALVAILLNFRVTPASETEFQKIELDENSPFVVLPKKGTKLTFQPL